LKSFSREHPPASVFAVLFKNSSRWRGAGAKKCEQTDQNETNERIRYSAFREPLESFLTLVGG
jgi:hypothetical protein